MHSVLTVNITRCRPDAFNNGC